MKLTAIIPLCFILIVGVSAIQSCCKSYCTDDDIFALDFHGFSAAELEKIKVLRFNPGIFNSAIDSYYVSTNNIIINNPTRVYLDTPIVSDFSFKINVEKAGLSYNVSDFQTEKGDCNCGTGTYDKIIGYKVNGVQFSAASQYTLEIKK